MSDLHIVTGAGPIGWTVAEQLAGQGHRVRLLTRSGSGPEHPLVERLKIDVSQPALEAAIEGGAAVFHCIHASAYSAKTWARELPAAEQTVLKAAGRAGAVVVFPESLYAYDRPQDVMPEQRCRRSVRFRAGWCAPRACCRPMPANWRRCSTSSRSRLSWTRPTHRLCWGWHLPRSNRRPGRPYAGGRMNKQWPHREFRPHLPPNGNRYVY